MMLIRLCGDGTIRLVCGPANAYEGIEWRIDRQSLRVIMGAVLLCAREPWVEADHDHGG
jgi:hypothetical protein